VRVTTVDDDVSLLHVRLELGDKVVDGLTGLDEEDDLSGGLELLAELLDRVSTDDVGAWEQLKARISARITPPVDCRLSQTPLKLTLGLVLEEVVNLGSGPVVRADLEALCCATKRKKTTMSCRFPSISNQKAQPTLSFMLRIYAPP
jgi:hypothetical protein